MSLTTWPSSLLPSTYRLEVLANTVSGGRSSYDRSEQLIAMPGARWVARLTFRGLDRTEHRDAAAFVAAQQGRAGVFLWSPPAMPARGSWVTDAALPQIDGGGQTGRILALKGLLPSRPAVFQPGDLLSFVDPLGRMRLHQVIGTAAGQLSAAASNASGRASVMIAPPLRRSPADNTPLQLVPSGRFRLSRDSNPFDYAEGMNSDVTIEMEEAL